MFDISAVGSKVRINFAEGTTVNITHFSDEGTPFESNDADVSTNSKNLNGEMISSRTPTVYSVSVTVIPGSDEDIALSRRLADAALQPGNVKEIKKLKVNSLQISIPKQDASAEGSSSTWDYTWTNGRMKSGPTGPSTSSEGRLSARTYTFELEKFSGAA